MNIENDPEIFKALLELGLTKNEAKVYMALVDMGEGKASEISRKSGVTREKTYRVLKKLEERRLVKVIDGQPVRWRPMPPSDYFKPLIEVKKQSVEKMERVIHELQKIYSISREKDAKEELNVWEIGERDFDSIFHNALDSCRKHIYALVTPIGIDLLTNPDISKMLRKLSKANVNIEIYTWLEGDSIHAPGRLSNYADVYILDGEVPDYSLILIDSYIGFLVKDGRSPIIFYSDHKIGNGSLSLFRLMKYTSTPLKDYIDYYDALGSMEGKEIINERGIKNFLINVYEELIHSISVTLHGKEKEELYDIISEAVRRTLMKRIQNYDELTLGEKIKLLRTILRKTIVNGDLNATLDRIFNQLHLTIEFNIEKEKLADAFSYFSVSPRYPHPIIMLMDYEIRVSGYKRLDSILMTDNREGKLTVKYMYGFKKMIKTHSL